MALLAGFVSFLSPCVLPLVPGYLGYVTGLTGIDLQKQKRGRMLAGIGLFVLGYGLARFTVEFFREPDSQLRAFAEKTGLHMGQWLCVPMILGGLFLILTAAKRRIRVESIAGAQSVA